MEMIEQELNMYVSECNRKGLGKAKAILLNMMKVYGVRNYIDNGID